jgi:hypothetical protein
VVVDVVVGGVRFVDVLVCVEEENRGAKESETGRCDLREGTW